MTTMLRRLMAEAARLEATVHLAHLEAPLIGHYDHERREILIHLGLIATQRDETLAHELGHCFYGDTGSTDFTERRADKRAALLLVDVDHYRIAETINPDPQSIADELGVTRRIVRIFQRQILPDLSLRRRA